MVDIKLEIPGFEQLVTATVSGIGAVGGPMLARWKARAEADALRIEGQGKGDALLLIAEAQAKAQEILGGIPSSIHGEIDVRGEIQARLSFQEEKKQANIESVVSGAAVELDGKQVQAHDVDHDWTARFFTEVQDVSSEKNATNLGKNTGGRSRNAGHDIHADLVDIEKYVAEGCRIV